jgi:pyruvate,water dikinase
MTNEIENLDCGRPGTGIPQLNALLQGLFPGDNLVWQIDDLREYSQFALPFAHQALCEGRSCVYLRFGSHPPVLPAEPGIEIISVDPKPGFDHFTKTIHDIITERGGLASYVFDNLSSLVSQWATDELLADFFQVTCPYILKLEALAYFALTYGQHSYQAIARIKSTTQILINIYRADSALYLHPQKVLGRYSAEMFLPHRITDLEWQPVFESGEAATISSGSFHEPLIKETPGKSPWESIYARLLQYQRTAGEETQLPAEITALKREYIHMVIGEHREFARIAEKYLSLDDLIAIRGRLIGSGRIGGKAAGMLLARRILLAEPGEIDFARVLDPHDSFFVGSDVFFTFLVNNNLFQIRLDLTRNQHLSHEEYETVQQLFLKGDFFPEIVAQFRNMLDYFGQAPIIVRSSSLMEDSLGNAFAGKYRSEFLVNQGNPEERLSAFLQAIKLVYASTLNPDAIAYRHRQGLSESDELMAILVQRVSGMPYKHYFFPTVAGVGFSRNIYPWTSRIDPHKGLLRLVFGLGTRAVNRIGGDYSRMIALSHPELRPEIGAKIARYSQHNADVLDLETNELLSISLNKLLSPHYDYPHLEMLGSVLEDGLMCDLLFHSPSEIQPFVMTLDNLIRHTPFAQVMQNMLGVLDQAYGHAVDTEFTLHIADNNTLKINLLQCRGLRLPEELGKTEIPLNLPQENVLFRSAQAINGGTICDIRYILYIEPGIYASASLESKHQLGRLIGRLTQSPQVTKDKIILIGPGRWGSTNIQLGVNVSYADISHAAVLAEVASEETGHIPEVSFGTHFFQDLVESQMIYMAIFPGQPDSQFNQAFFHTAPNSLLQVLPDAAGFASLIKLINVIEATGGLSVCVVADPISRQAVGYLK